MSIGSDSRVVDALHDGATLERLLRELGCKTDKVEGPPSFDEQRGYIHCPNPNHPDHNPSCIVRANQGLFHCIAVCDTILPLDLVVAHGKAKDRGEAARWIEQHVLGIDPDERVRDDRPIISDPGLTLEQYLLRKHLSADVAHLFGLREVEVWAEPKYAPKKVRATFADGYYPAVFMPVGDPTLKIDEQVDRFRIRSDFGARWPAGVWPRGMGGDRTTKVAGNSGEIAARQHIYGRWQMRASADPMLGRILILVEGESDTHTMQDCGLANVLGLPGTEYAMKCAPDIVETLSRVEPGATGEWTVLVWSEPGAAGSALPGKVQAALAAHCAEAGVAAPRVAALDHTTITVEPQPGQPPVHPKDPSELLALLVPRMGVQPARVEAGRLLTQVAFLAAGRAPAQLDPAAPAVAVQPAQAQLPPAPTMHVGEDPWQGMGGDGGLEAPDPSDPLSTPREIIHQKEKFLRTGEGWEHHFFTAKGDLRENVVASIIEVVDVQQIDGEDHIVLRAPRTHQLDFHTTRVPRSMLADTRALSAAASSIGVTVGMRQGTALAHLIAALADYRLRQGACTIVPSATGWSGVAGTGPFSGIDIRPSNSFGERMFDANERRRQRCKAAGLDVRAAAAEWMERCALPLTRPPKGRPASASHAAPLLAIGAAAAGVLIGPLSDLGVAVSPVVWMAGLGGGGKTQTQRVCAAIFAPNLPDLDGQGGYFCNANISPAALNARAQSCRDLPLLMDDVQTMPPLAGSQSKGDGARIEAAAALGMQIFNRKPVERAQRDGTVRLQKPFRSTAVLSAEVNMSSDSSRAVVTAGHRRRITTIEAQPMNERGLGAKFADALTEVEQRFGGAPGEVLVAHVRDLKGQQRLERQFGKCRRAVLALPGAGEVTNTQRESIAVDVLGWALLRSSIAGESEDACDAMLEQAIAEATQVIAPFLLTGAGEGGATRDTDLGGVGNAVRTVEDILAANPHRFDSAARETWTGNLPAQGFIGKVLKPTWRGERRVALLKAGVDALMRQGVSSAVIEQAISEGVAMKAQQIRMTGGSRVYAQIWTLPAREEVDEDSAAHDTDPQGLSQPVASDVHVPGMAAASWTNEPLAEPQGPALLGSRPRPGAPLMPAPMQDVLTNDQYTPADLRAGRAIYCPSCDIVFASTSQSTGSMCGACGGWATQFASRALADRLEGKPMEALVIHSGPRLKHPPEVAAALDEVYPAGGAFEVWLSEVAGVARVEPLTTPLPDAIRTLEEHAELTAPQQKLLTLTPYRENNMVMDSRFAWGKGVYYVGDAAAMRGERGADLHAAIRRNAQEEFASIVLMYEAAAKRDPAGAVEVKPLLGIDPAGWADARWAAIDALGEENARGQWVLAERALSLAMRAAQPTPQLLGDAVAIGVTYDEQLTPEAWQRIASGHYANTDATALARALHVISVKAYRVHLMARLRWPAWFIEDAPAALR